MPDFSHEERIGGVVAGVDEAGRGPLAGPVTAAAAVIDRARAPRALLALIDDSKKLGPARREAAYAALTECEAVRFAIAEASVTEIDALDILRATMLAMRRAVLALDPPPDRALVDGNRAPALPCPAETLVRGDGLSLSVAAASILAKVSRDRTMRELHAAFPRYGWDRNAGYGSAAHLAAIREHGPTPHHRTSFAPFRRRD